MKQQALYTKAFQHTAARRRLDKSGAYGCGRVCRFNTQPPEGGWAEQNYPSAFECEVSTHSRPKAAGKKKACLTRPILVSTHSRPKAAGLG